MPAAIARQIINRLVVLAVCLTPLFYLPGLRLMNALLDSKWYLLHAIGGALLAFWGIRLLAGEAGSARSSRKRPDELRGPGPTHWPLIGYLGCVAVSALASTEPALSLRAGLIPAYFLLLSLTPLLLNWPPAQIRRLLLFVLTTGLLVALSAFWQVVDEASFYKLIPYRVTFGEARVSVLGTIGNPEYLGTFLAPILLLGAPALLWERGWRRVGLAAVLGLMALVILLTTARGAVLGVAVGALVLLGLIQRRKLLPFGRRVLIALAGLAAAVLVLAALLSFPNPVNVKGWEILPRFARMFDVHSDSIYERIVFYSIAADMIASHPLTGTGEGMFGVQFYHTLYAMSERDPGAAIEGAFAYLNNRVATKAHSDWLEIWAENGTPAFLAFLLAMVVTLRLGWQAACQPPDAASSSSRATNAPHPSPTPPSLDHSGSGNHRLNALTRDSRSAPCALMLALYPAFVCILVYSLFSFPMQMPSRGPLFWAIWGCLAQTIRLIREERA
ncbi:MAG: hypothetical protein Kow0059_09160 [Candidatus Sumerlaeia bacterium]